MTRRACAGPFAMLAGALATGGAHAVPPVTVYGGVEVGNTNSNRVDAGVSVRFPENLATSVSLARAHVEFPGETTDSTLAVAKASYDIGAYNIGAGYRHGEIADVSTNHAWFVNAGYVHEELRFGVEVESRNTTLEPAAFTEDLGGTLGTVSGISHCSVDGRGYQGRVDWDRPTWSAFASWRTFDYDDYDCALDITSNVPPPGNGNGNGNGNGHGHGPPPHAHGRALGRRLAADSVDNAIGAASRLVPRETALLDSSASLGFTTPVAGQWIGGVELYRDVERIDSSETLTGLVFAGRRLSDAWSVEISLGYSAADTIEDTAFAGVRVTGSL
jgi:hypothetical protein